jgi:hypothetical protein
MTPAAARLKKAAAPISEAERAKNLAESGELLGPLMREAFDRDVAGGDPGPPRHDHGLDIDTPDDLQHCCADGIDFVRHDRAHGDLMAPSLERTANQGPASVIRRRPGVADRDDRT